MKITHIISIMLFAICITSSIQADNYKCICKNNKKRTAFVASSFEDPKPHCEHACKNDGGLKEMQRQ